MKNVTITTIKLDVYNEVAKMTSYTGAKMEEDPSAYERIFTTDSDRLMLERYWIEACDLVTDTLKEYVVEVNDHHTGHGIELDNNYIVSLSLSSAWDESREGNLGSTIFSFFVYYILSKWYALANKTEAAAYATEAQGRLLDVMKVIYHRQKPTRENPT